MKFIALKDPIPKWNTNKKSPRSFLTTHNIPSKMLRSSFTLKINKHNFKFQTPRLNQVSLESNLPICQSNLNTPSSPKPKAHFPSLFLRRTPTGLSFFPSSTMTFGKCIRTRWPASGLLKKLTSPKTSKTGRDSTTTNATSSSMC